MSLLSLPAVVMAGLVFYVGGYHLLIFSRRPQNREDLTFALTCFAIGVYDLFCAGLYGAASVEEGIYWQRLQIVGLGLAGIALLWFVADYTSQRSKKMTIGFSACYALLVVIAAVERRGLTWSDQPLVKHIRLPFGIEFNYYEMASGPVTDFFSLLGLAVFLYIFWEGVRLYLRGQRRKAFPLLLALILSFVGVFNDSAVSSGLYSFVYLIEYSYLALVLLMAYSLSNELIASTKIRAALMESEKKYRELADSLPQIVFETDENGKLTFVNQNAFTVFGYTQSDFNTGLNALDILFSDDQERGMENIQKIMRGESMGGVEYTAQRKDGSIFPILVHSNAIVRDKKPIGLRGIIIDLTKQKQAEEERERLEAKLQRAQKMEALGLLAGGVAHDLNNVLSAIVSYPDLLLLDLPEDSPLRRPIMIMQDSGRKAATIVQDLLTLARRGVITTEILNLNDIVSEYLISPEQEKIQSYHPTIQIQTDLAAKLPTIRGSKVHLKKTLMNLVANAAEAQPKGGKITISTENEYIDRPVKGHEHGGEGEYIVIKVADEGTGIAPDDQKRIYEPFYTKKVMGRSGTGLGMAVVWGTVQDHRGFINLESTVGKGTTFELYFPLAREDLTPEKRTESIEDLKGNYESILVVDDVKEQREIAENLLTVLNYSVTTVSGGEEAVCYLQHNTVDLLVLDMIMDPGIDGLETYKRILKLNPGQKAVIVSGFSETESVLEAQRLGAGTYVKKPYSLEKIGMAVKSELHK